MVKHLGIDFFGFWCCLEASWDQTSIKNQSKIGSKIAPLSDIDFYRVLDQNWCNLDFQLAVKIPQKWRTLIECFYFVFFYSGFWGREGRGTRWARGLLTRFFKDINGFFGALLHPFGWHWMGWWGAARRA